MENGPVERLSVPIKNGGSFHVGLLEGKWRLFITGKITALHGESSIAMLEYQMVIGSLQMIYRW